MIGASCHDATTLDARSGVEVDFAVLGPVHATPTHPGAVPLGFARFAQIALGTRVPVYALGGLSERDLRAAVDHGAHGVALRRGAWLAR
jgi:8-oxo-dGTP diphosphatase